MHPETVAVGPWWRLGGQDEIDAVVLAGSERRPVLVGEAKWARTVSGGREVARLAALGDDDAELRFAVCARDEVTHVPPDTMVVTARDVFAARD